MKSISHFSVLIISPEYSSKEFIDAVITHNGLENMPVNIYGTDTLLAAGETRTPDGLAGEGDDPTRIAAEIYDREVHGWSGLRRTINVSLVDIVIADYTPSLVYMDGRLSSRGAISLLLNLQNQLRDIPPFLFVTDDAHKDEGAPSQCGESVESLLSNLGRSRLRFKFHRKSDAPEIFREEIYRLLRDRDSLIEFVNLKSSSEPETGSDENRTWVKIRRSADTDYRSFQKLYVDIFGHKPRPAGVLFRRTEKGAIELFSPSVRPAKNKLSELSTDISDLLPVTSRTWISHKTGRIAFQIAESSGDADSSRIAMRLPSVTGRLSGQRVFEDIVTGAFPLAPQGSGVTVSIPAIRSLLAQLRLPAGEIDTQVFSHVFKTFPAIQSVAGLPIGENPAIAAMCEKMVSDLAFERAGQDVVFTVSDTAQGARCPEEIRITVQALLVSPVGVTPALCYIDNILDALRLLEAPRPMAGACVETASLYGLKIAPRHEVYELSLDFKPSAADTSQAETQRFVQATLYMLHEFMSSLIVQDLRRDISIFDLIGPSMIGPSSSHTCGANRIGRLARRTIAMLIPPEFDPESDVLCLSARLHNSFRKAGEGHRTHNALAAGLLHDLPQDHTGNENERLDPWGENPPEGRPDNIAFYDFRPWYNGTEPMTCRWVLDDGKAIDVHWAGYHKFNPTKNGADIPLPETHPSDLHENSVAIVAAAMPRDSFGKDSVKNRLLLNPEDREFRWDDFDIVVTGESLGGGKIRMRSAGGKWLAERREYFTSRGWASPSPELVFVPRDSEAAPLDGNHAFDYPGISNLNPIYPPEGEQATEDVLPYHDLDSMIEYANISGRDLFRIAIDYETWCLGLKSSERITEKIILEAREMLRSLDESSQPFGDIDFDSNTPETSNVIKTYMNLREAFNNVNAEFLGNSFYDAVSGAITAMTRNAFSQLILAAPTGGACGVLPGVYRALKNIKVTSGQMSEEEFEEKAVRSLLVCGFLAALTANIVPPSGAEKGCQAETGTASGMGAAFATYFLDGTRDQTVNAMILSMKNSLGLVCDPIAGKVNTPCIKRNAFKAVESMIGAWLSLNGIVSFVSPNQVVKAMSQIGDDMASRYRETSEGGLAKTIDGLKERMCKFG